MKGNEFLNTISKKSSENWQKLCQSKYYFFYHVDLFFFEKLSSTGQRLVIVSVIFVSKILLRAWNKFSWYRIYKSNDILAYFTWNTKIQWWMFLIQSANVSVVKWKKCIFYSIWLRLSRLWSNGFCFHLRFFDQISFNFTIIFSHPYPYIGFHPLELYLFQIFYHFFLFQIDTPLLDYWLWIIG